MLFIKHYRPQLLRNDVMISHPTFGDNRATMQNFQSMGATANNVYQNTSSGQVSRAQMLATSGKMFDGMNQSNEQTNNGNVAISNQWNQQTDQILNANNHDNNLTLANFITNNHKYRANLTEEKDLKHKNTMEAINHMISNRDQMAAIQSRTPNYHVSKNWWTPQFTGRQGVDLLSQNGQSNGDSIDQTKLEYDKVKGMFPNWAPADIRAFLEMHSNKSKSTINTKTGAVTKREDTTINR